MAPKNKLFPDEASLFEDLFIDKAVESEDYVQRLAQLELEKEAFSGIDFTNVFSSRGAVTLPEINEALELGKESKYYEEPSSTIVEEGPYMIPQEVWDDDKQMLVSGDAIEGVISPDLSSGARDQIIPLDEFKWDTTADPEEETDRIAKLVSEHGFRTTAIPGAIPVPEEYKKILNQEGKDMYFDVFNKPRSQKMNPLTLDNLGQVQSEVHQLLSNLYGEGSKEVHTWNIEGFPFDRKTTDVKEYIKSNPEVKKAYNLTIERAFEIEDEYLKHLNAYNDNVKSHPDDTTGDLTHQEYLNEGGIDPEVFKAKEVDVAWENIYTPKPHKTKTINYGSPKKFINKINKVEQDFKGISIGNQKINVNFNNFLNNVVINRASTAMGDITETTLDDIKSDETQVFVDIMDTSDNNTGFQILGSVTAGKGNNIFYNEDKGTNIFSESEMPNLFNKLEFIEDYDNSSMSSAFKVLSQEITSSANQYTIKNKKTGEVIEIVGDENIQKFLTNINAY